MQLGEFISANTHVNDITGCLIWDGEYIKGGEPVAQIGTDNIRVRKIMFDSINGIQPRQTKYSSTCENPRCVKLEHISTTVEKKEPDYPWEKVAEAAQLQAIGYRHDVIAEKLGVNPSTISKWLKANKERKSTQEPPNAELSI